MRRDDLSDLLAFLAVARERRHAGERLLAAAGPRIDEVEVAIAALSEIRDEPGGTIRIMSSDHAANTIVIPKLAPLLSEYPDIRVEICIDYGLTDIVTERYDAGVRLGEHVAKGMIDWLPRACSRLKRFT